MYIVQVKQPGWCHCSKKSDCAATILTGNILKRDFSKWTYFLFNFLPSLKKNLPSGGEESGCSSEKGLPKVKLILQGRLPQKTGKCGNFFQVGDPPPVWEPHVCEKKYMVYFAFQDLRNIFGFQKMFTFWVVLWFVEVGTGDPPPSSEKFPLYPVLLDFFYRMSTRGPKTELT